MSQNDAATPASTPAEATADITLSVFGEPLRARITVPTGPTRTADLLPLFRGLADAFVARAEAHVAAEGRTVSCRKGCGACCRQLVPVSEVEARHLRDLVMAMPEPHRTAVRERFAAARERLTQAGLADSLTRPEDVLEDDVATLGMRYMALRIPCPFLVDESCSIHGERPIVCREFLVTSPAVHCANPTAETVARVPMPTKVFTALATLDLPSTATKGRWVPLVLALEWADAHPEAPPTRSGREIVEAFLARLKPRDAPPVPPSAGVQEDEGRA